MYFYEFMSLGYFCNPTVNKDLNKLINKIKPKTNQKPVTKVTIENHFSDWILAMVRKRKSLIKVYLIPTHHRKRQIVVLMKQGDWQNETNALLATKHMKLHMDWKSIKKNVKAMYQQTFKMIHHKAETMMLV